MEDLFEKNFDELPTELVEVLMEYLYDDFTYANCDNLVNDLNRIGYTCDFGLDAEPFDLRKLTDEEFGLLNLKVGDEVIWRGSYGEDLPKEVIVTSIELNGVIVNSVLWDIVDSDEVIVDLDNGKWAYGFQIRKKIINNLGCIVGN